MLGKFLLILVILCSIIATSVYLFSAPKKYNEMTDFTTEYFKEMCLDANAGKTLFKYFPVSYQSDTNFIASLDQYLKKCVKYVPDEKVYRLISENSILNIGGNNLNVSDMNPYISSFKAFGYFDLGDGNVNANKVGLEVSCLFKDCHIDKFTSNKTSNHSLDQSTTGLTAIHK